MSKITFSGLGITEARGKIGNEVMFRNQGGACARAYASPVVIPNAYGLQYRDAYAILANGWQVAPQSYRDAWNLAARSLPNRQSIVKRGQMSGFNYFVSQTLAIYFAGGAPTYYPIPPEPLIQIEENIMYYVDAFGLAGAILSLPLVVAVPINHSLQFYASVGVSPGIHFKKTGINFIGQFPEGSTVPYSDLFTRYTANYGTPVSGTKIFWGARFVNFRTGQTGKRIYTSVIVT